MINGKNYFRVNFRKGSLTAFEILLDVNYMYLQQNFDPRVLHHWNLKHQKLGIKYSCKINMYIVFLIFLNVEDVENAPAYFFSREHLYVQLRIY